jgi:SPP1 Gp6-like portal protein
MPNILQRIQTRFDSWFWGNVSNLLNPERIKELTLNREYYGGKQRRLLKVKSGQFDDNLTTNFLGLAVDRSTSMLFGGGVDFEVPEGNEDDKKLFLDETWAANKKDVFLHRASVDGEIYGTVFIKIIPDGKEFNGKTYPRLVLLDPSLMDIQCNPMDIEQVEQYVFEIKMGDQVFREVTRLAKEDDEFDQGNGFSLKPQKGSWIIEKFKSGRGGLWVMDGDPVVWEFPFPPIVHIQNLPSVHSVYGVPGIDGLIEIQDKYNFTVSNLLKIVRYHSHPRTWGSGIPANAQLEKISWGADEMIKITDPNGKIANLEMASDLASSRNIAQDLRQSMFDLARVVDIASITDKVGALTNFGLRVLYSDALAKNATRRALYGDGLVELNRRMLIINEMDGQNDVTWGPDMPADEKEDAELILKDLAAAIVSRETASELRGYVWKSTVNSAGVPISGEEDKIKAEVQAGGNLENLALANFFSGREVPR